MDDIRLHWDAGGCVRSAATPFGAPLDTRDFALTSSEKQLGHGRLLTVELRPTGPLRVLSLTLTPALPAPAVSAVVANGYQSWTRTEALNGRHRIRGVPWPLRAAVGACGEDPLRRARAQRERYRGWTYCSLRHSDGTVTLVGSTDERFAYTILTFDFRVGGLLVEKDTDGLLMSQAATPLHLYVGHGEEREVWDEYASLWAGQPRHTPRVSGWTSWYYHYTAITQDIILHDLEAIRASGLPLDIFQIDDGYQAGIGDWLETNTKFRDGMKPLATAIRNAGFRPGLWLAPFICDRASRLYREHPEWLLRRPGGRPVAAGWHAGWNGYYYALDFYAPGLQDHLRRIFRTGLDDWGYDLVKLDFLFAAALEPRPDRTRGGIMTDAMDFLREVVGQRWILGCGVPLGPAFGKVELCRIGSDVAPVWRRRDLERLGSREHPSARNSLASTVGRWQINRRFFSSDPDVFILREQKNRLSPTERHTLHLLNYVLGDVLFFSDDLSQYTPEQLGQIRSMYPLLRPEVVSLHEPDGVTRIEVVAEHTVYLVLANLSERRSAATLPHAGFSVATGPLATGAVLTLEPHRSLCFRRVDPDARAPYLLGSNGHLLPGADVIGCEIRDQSVSVDWHPEARADSEIYLGVEEGARTLRLNGRTRDVLPAQSDLGPWVALARG